MLNNSFRFCVHFRKFNQITEFNTEKMPNSKHIFTKLSTSQYFTKIDLSRSFGQVRVKESDSHILHFTIQFGSYMWKVMPFGVSNVSSITTSLQGRGVKYFMDNFNFRH